MRTLIVAATEAEVAPLAGRLGAGVDLLVTGVGMVATAVRCSRALAGAPYDLAVNVGICGSFDPALAPPAVVHVVSDRIAELGAEDGETFLSVEELQLAADSTFVNEAPPDLPGLKRLPAVSAITVNTAHGNEHSIAAVVRRWHPQVESMEGAAFMCACLVGGVRFAQVRAVSNAVARRDRRRWRVAEAIDALARTVSEMLRPS